MLTEEQWDAISGIAPTSPIDTTTQAPTQSEPPAENAASTAKRRAEAIEDSAKQVSAGASMKSCRDHWTQRIADPHRLEIFMKEIAQRVEEITEANRVANEQARQKALGDQLLAAVEEFGDEADKRDQFGTKRVTAAAEALARYITPQIMDAANAQLRRQSVGEITVQDIAFIGLVHWDSVTADKAPEIRRTSPAARIQRAAVKFGYRPTPFHLSQIAMARKLLSTLGITRQTESAIHYHGGDQRNRAAIWTVTDNKEWYSVFAGRSGK